MHEIEPIKVNGKLSVYKIKGKCSICKKSFVTMNGARHTCYTCYPNQKVDVK